MLKCLGDWNGLRGVTENPRGFLAPVLGAHLCDASPRYVTGWFSPYHRRRKLIHPVMIQHIQPQALR